MGGSKTLRIRQSVYTEIFVRLNSQINEYARMRIEGTPFKWLLEMPTAIQINTPVLLELITRWDKVGLGFRVGTQTVPFTLVDVCLAIGLPVVGRPIQLVEDQSCHGHITRIFDKENISINELVDKIELLNNRHNVDDYCRLYILLGFCLFYFPNTHRENQASKIHFTLLDDLDSLHQFNWGHAVHEYLARGLNFAFEKVSCSKNSVQMHLSGCTPILEIWAVEHMSLHVCHEKKFPRILSWTNYMKRKPTVSKHFKYKKVVEELCLNKDDLANDVLAQAIGEAGEDQHNIPIPLIEKICRDHDVLFAQNSDLKENMVQIKVEVDMLTSNKRKSCHESPMGEDMPNFDSTFFRSLDKKRTKRRMDFFRFCTQRTKDKEILERHIVEVPNKFWTVNDFGCMRPREWVNNFIINLHGYLLMDTHKDENGHVTRFHFTTEFGEKVIQEIDLHKLENVNAWNTKMFSLKTMRGYKNVLKNSHLVFAPVLYDSHWACHVVNRRSHQIFVLDSMFDERSLTADRFLADMAVARRLTELMTIYDSEFGSPSLEYVKLPKQQNGNDCGVYVMKYMEIWDGVTKWGDFTMPYWSQEDVNEIRRDLVCDWVTHPSNSIFNQVLADAGIQREEIV